MREGVVRCAATAFLILHRGRSCPNITHYCLPLPFHYILNSTGIDKIWNFSLKTFKLCGEGKAKLDTIVRVMFFLLFPNPTFLYFMGVGVKKIILYLIGLQGLHILLSEKLHLADPLGLTSKTGLQQFPARCFLLF